MKILREVSRSPSKPKRAKNELIMHVLILFSLDRDIQLTLIKSQKNKVAKKYQIYLNSSDSSLKQFLTMYFRTVFRFFAQQLKCHTPGRNGMKIIKIT